MQTFKYQEELNGSMATITININDQLSKRFREVVKQENGESKGVIGKAIEEALTIWLKQKQEEEIAKRELDFLKKGFKMGKLKKYSREELYDRKY